MSFRPDSDSLAVKINMFMLYIGNRNRPMIVKPAQLFAPDIPVGTTEIPLGSLLVSRNSDWDKCNCNG